MNPPPAEGLASRLFLGPALRTQPDRRLVTLVRDGYESAFEEIVRRYGRPLGRYAAAIVGGRSEEVTQDAFSKALLALRGMEGDREVELRPWLYRIVRNTALNDLRDRPPEAAELGEAIAGGRSAAEEFESREEVARLLEGLRALPDHQRAAIVMRELEGLGHEEIADALGLSGGGARQAIYRARQALRDGVGMLVPLPLLRALIDHGTEAGAAAGAGGAAAAGTAIGGAGAGGALKVGAIAAAVLAGGLGTGLALKDHHHRHGPETAAAAVTREARPGARGAAGPSFDDTAAEASGRVAELGDADSAGRGDRGSGGSRGSGGPGESGHGGGGRGQDQPGETGGGGPGPSEDDEGGGGRGGGQGPPPQAAQGQGPGPRGEGGSGTSGGSGGGGRGGSGNSDGSSSGGGSGESSGGGSGSGDGSGSGSQGEPQPAPPPPPAGQGSSGSGSSGSGSGSPDSGGSGGSGSGSGGSGTGGPDPG
jgi:RNA polymerase sigma factor (sigma-70 family)